MHAVIGQLLYNLYKIMQLMMSQYIFCSFIL